MDRKEELEKWIRNRIATREFQDFLTHTLFDLCEIPTVPGRDIEETRENEERAFELLKRIIAPYRQEGAFEYRPILPAIFDDEAFTPPYYTGDVATAYRDRCNLLFTLPGANPSEAGARNIALNAHIDTVAPYFAPQTENGSVKGRGAADDKGGCIAIAGALRLLSEVRDELGIAPAGNVVSMFVIDEETGGNGSLSLALDEGICTACDTLVVVESADSQIYPANRGALWYKVDVDARATGEPVLLACYLVLALEAEGAALRAESSHPLFPDRPVQTCQGVLGPYGEHPSRVCGHVEVVFTTKATGAEVEQRIDAAISTYIGDYGDKTREIRAETGKPKVDHHVDLRPAGTRGFRLAVWGTTGHMGAVRENDDAITKAAYILTELHRADPALSVDFPEEPTGDVLILEGGQGFLPTHTITQVRERLQIAIEKGAAAFRKAGGIAGAVPALTTDKLHNDAFDGDANAASVVDAAEAAGAAGIDLPDRLVGMPVSCDARLFARKWDALEVVTTGPGALSQAHSDGEHINVAELAQGAAFLALYVLIHGGMALQ